LTIGLATAKPSAARGAALAGAARKAAAMTPGRTQIRIISS
jgi:hypothetical protein